MKQITVGLLAHVDAGKTTLTEQLLYQSGALRQAGSVDDGTAQTDFLDVERRRGISVRASSTVLCQGDWQMNLIDTPGHADFAAETERALLVLDMAILVISAVEGIEPQTEVLLDAIRKTDTRVLYFLNKTDRTGSRTRDIIEELRHVGTAPILCLTALEGEGTRECRVRLRNLSDPDFREEVMEAVALQNEEVLEAYVAGTRVRDEELLSALQEQVEKGQIELLLMGSAKQGMGVKELLSALKTFARPVRNREDDALSGVIYRVTHDKSMGRVAHVRLFGGSLACRDTVKLPSGEEEKISQIRRYTGSRFVDLPRMSRGDVAALCGLHHCKAGDILGEIAGQTGMELSVPLWKVQVIPQKPEEYEALGMALEELSAEDPKLQLERIPEERELDIAITGTMQEEILQALLQSRYGLTASFSSPTVIYKETPAAAGRGYTAYTMPKPCWAIIELSIEPGPRGSGLHFSSNVPNDQIFYRYQNHIRQCLPRALQQGLYNWEVIDLSVTLTGGSHHTVHTHPLDFFLATPMAVMDGLTHTGTVLLEPIQRVRLSAPEACLGKVIGDMITLRGTYDTPVIHQGRFTMECRIPAATFLSYPVRFMALSGGRGSVSARFDGYEPCPPECGAVARRRGVNPLDREKWILTQRSAMTEGK